MSTFKKWVYVNNINIKRNIFICRPQIHIKQQILVIRKNENESPDNIYKTAT